MHKVIIYEKHKKKNRKQVVEILAQLKQNVFRNLKMKINKNIF